MIDVLAIATSGYINLDRKTFSIATDGYYPNTVIGTIPIDPPRRDAGGFPSASPGGGFRTYVHEENNKEKLLYLQEEEDIAYILSIFIQKWG